MTTTSKNKMIHNYLSENISGTALDNSDLAKARIGVIGGSGVYNIKWIKNLKEIEIDTPFGKTSDNLLIGNLDEIEIIFLARHGRNHTLNPTEVPYKANIWAFRYLNVRWILSPSAVGSLKENIKPLDMVIPNQFIDRTQQRPLTFFCDGAVAHVSMADPFCANLSKILIEEAKKFLPLSREVHIGGTYLAMEGPAFSTRAESNLYRQWGCSVIGMTNHTEARLAREAEIAYVTLAMVTDYDCWHHDHANVTVEMIIKNVIENAKIGEEIIKATALKVASIRPSSSAHNSLRNGLVTSPEKVPKQTLKKLEVLTKKYWDN